MLRLHMQTHATHMLLAWECVCFDGKSNDSICGGCWMDIKFYETPYSFPVLQQTRRPTVSVMLKQLLSTYHPQHLISFDCSWGWISLSNVIFQLSMHIHRQTFNRVARLYSYRDEHIAMSDQSAGRLAILAQGFWILSHPAITFPTLPPYFLVDTGSLQLCAVEAECCL